MKRTLRILMTNDDGYRAKGIRCLYDELSAAHDVVVVAPQNEQSGISHAFTHAAAIRCKPMPPAEGMREGYIVNGTPSDCVKLALGKILEIAPDIVVSGINAGENSGLAGYYSGTVAAAREAAFWEINAAAFSLCSEGMEYLKDYARAARRILERIADIHSNGFPDTGKRIFYNVNFPVCSPEKCAGIKVTRQSCTFFDDRYRIESDGPEGRAYRLYGERKCVESHDEYDSRAIKSGYIAITPLHFDATAEEEMKLLKEKIPTELIQEAAYG